MKKKKEITVNKVMNQIDKDFHGDINGTVSFVLSRIVRPKKSDFISNYYITYNIIQFFFYKDIDRDEFNDCYTSFLSISVNTIINQEQSKSLFESEVDFYKNRNYSLRKMKRAVGITIMIGIINSYLLHAETEIDLISLFMKSLAEAVIKFEDIDENEILVSHFFEVLEFLRVFEFSDFNIE